jgi:hypothetical protein
MRATTLLLLFIATAFLADSALAQIYTWRDASGTMHYGDIPPPEAADARKIHTQSTPPAEIDAARRALADKEMEAKKRQVEVQEAAEKARKEKTASEERAHNCSQAPSYLRTLESGQRISRMQPNGEQSYLDDKTRAQETESTRHAVDSLCK